MERTEERFSEIMLAELQKDPERLPAIRVRADAPTTGNFDWKDLFKSLLMAMEEPLVDNKVDMERWERPHLSFPSNGRNNRDLIAGDRPSIRLIRFAYEQTLKHRRPPTVLIDDAQHIGILSSGRKLLDQLNVIKSIADKSLVTHVLCGTYEMIPFRNLSGQLSRRSIDIHLSRYKAEDESQRQEFVNVLYMFQEHLPVPEAPDLMAKWDYFYERSIGCVGILKDSLYRSLSLALEKNSHTLPLKYVEKQALSVSQCAALLRETLAGEKESEEREEVRLLLRKGLGLQDEYQNINKEASTANDSNSSLIIKSAHRERRVGTRNPVRDTVGKKAG